MPTQTAQFSADDEPTLQNASLSYSRGTGKTIYIYIRANINGKNVLCLLDTGSEVSLLPLEMAQGFLLKPTTRTLLAANGSTVHLEDANSRQSSWSLIRSLTFFSAWTSWNTTDVTSTMVKEY